MRQSSLSLFGLLCAACTSTTIPSEEGQIDLNLPELTSQRLVSHRADMPVLLGSRTPVSMIAPQRPDPCFTAQLGGEAMPQLLVVEGRDPLRFTFEPTGDCPELPDLVPDRLTLDVIGPEDLTGRVVLPEVAWGRRQLDRDEVRLVQPDAVPEDLLPDPDEPLVLVTGVAAPLDAVLEYEGEPVLVGPGAGALEVTGDAALTLHDPLRATILPLSEGSGELQFISGSTTIPLGTWEAIAPRDVRRLKSAVILESDPETGAEHTAGVAVWGVDRQGRPVHGLPIETEIVRGPLQLPEYADPGPWYFMIGQCTTPWDLAGTVVERRLRFRYEGESETVDLSFDLTPLDPEVVRAESADWTPEDNCVETGATDGRSTCGCSTSGPGSSGLTALLLGALTLLRRRRRLHG